MRALTIALLCVLAVSLAAATLADPQQPPGAGAGDGGGLNWGGGTAQQDGAGNDTDGNSSESRASGGSSLPLTACVPALTSPVFAAGLVAFVLVVGYVGYRRDGLVPAIAILFVLGTALLPAWLLLTDCGADSSTSQRSELVPPVGNITGGGGGAVGGAGGVQTAFSPPVLLAGLLAVALVLGAVVFRASGDDGPDDTPSEEPDPTTEPEPETLAAIGDVAGEAADRIEDDVDVENEVYRAWHEMTAHLDVGNPQASTPTEFAAAARDAGMDDAHVDTLTGLFQDVRYGGADATPEREDRAVDALRAIEATYGGER